MYALVIYESMFGNTRRVAEAVAKGLSSHLRAETVEVSRAPDSVGGEVGLLVIGGPTHAFSMTKPTTRASAARHATKPLVSPGIGIREWLDRARLGHVQATAFDTRVRHMPGSAARAAVTRLHRLGATIAGSTQSFYVIDATGPLMDGELERARDWGEQLGAAYGRPVRRGGLERCDGPC
ncbi:flavodoxin family protein [Nonomuraea sediminis]|uniref:flavodoxin family protein n=1 Tax=Nonomuraea sediminis TaxID=2835864 RepID=UPI001BDBC628|nr:flavodoxin family protein [Nonomuraea sediminis]